MTTSGEPVCCGETMVSYMGGWFWECADAFFQLQDDHAISDNGETPPVLLEPATDEHRALHTHLLATRESTCEGCGQRSRTQGDDGSLLTNCPKCGAR